MPELLAALDAFVQEHRRWGEPGRRRRRDRVWMTCDCGAGITHPFRSLRVDPTRVKQALTLMETGETMKILVDPQR
jgi:hypothetical protein